jgi:hypothetical protein
MHKHRCPRLTGLALINGLGLGLFLAAHREIEENNAISWEAVVDPPICNLNTDVTMPLLFLIIPLITTIGVWFVASKLFAALPHLSKFSLWSWVLVGIGQSADHASTDVRHINRSLTLPGRCVFRVHSRLQRRPFSMRYGSDSS